MRRFFVPDKENAKHFTGTKKCGSAKHHKGAKRRLVFCGTQAAYWRRSAYSPVMCSTGVLYIVYNFIFYKFLFFVMHYFLQIYYTMPFLRMFYIEDVFHQFLELLSVKNQPQNIFSEYSIILQSVFVFQHLQ